jgi:hypothetical protein
MSSKKCKKDEILNPETNRCVKRNGVVGKKVIAEMNKKKCKEDEILNPASNRCVKRNGAIGKKILAEMKKSKSKTSRKSRKSRTSRKSRKSRTSHNSRKSKKEKECGDDEILNPKTNRCVSIHGPTGKKILNKINAFKQIIRELIENKKVETKGDIKKILTEMDIDYSNYNLKEIIIDILDEILIEIVKELIDSGKVNTLRDIKKELKKRNIDYDNKSLKEIVINIVECQ